MQNLETQTSAERIKQLVEREGKSARNLVTWSVPVTNTARSEGYGRGAHEQDTSSNHSNSSRHTNAKRPGKNYRLKGKSNGRGVPAQVNGKAVGEVRPGHVGSLAPLSEREEVCEYYCSKTHRQSRSSKSPSRLDLHARYWSYLFDNLHRAVDEIYKTCEVDESIVECQEVIMTLEVCQKDFEALIKRIKLFGQSDLNTKSANIAWEVRKTTSPGKPRSHHVTPSPPPPSPLPALMTYSKKLAAKSLKCSSVRKETGDDVKTSIPLSPSLSSHSGSRPNSARSLDFNNAKNMKVHKKSNLDSKLESQTTHPTWADRVKGVSGNVTSSAASPKPHPPICEGKKSEDCLVSSEEEGGGWETVTRSRVRSSSVGGRSNQGSNSSQQEESSTTNTPSPTTTAATANTLSLQEKSSQAETTDTPSSSQEVPDGPTPSSQGVTDTPSSAGDIPSSSQATVISRQADNPSVTSTTDSTSPDAPSLSQTTAAPSHPTPSTSSTPSRSPSASGPLDTTDTSAEEFAPSSSTSQGNSHTEVEENDVSWSWKDALAVYNASEAYRAEQSWADRCDSPPGGLSDVTRSPGRAIHLHQRLSSPSRKRPVEEETRRIQEEKQVKAQLQRSKLQEEKTLKSKVEADKIREARENRDALAKQRKEALEDKLQRAEMLRESHLQEIIRKAQEEEAKVSEISFINTLEAQNRKIEVQERYQGRKARFQELLDERQRKKDEQLAKEEAAQERRRTKETERHTKLMELDQKRKEQEVKVEHMLLERERVREEAAKEKSKERERKLLAHNAALQSSTEELGRKIQLKHDESSKRYDQQLEQKKKLATGVISSRHTSAEQPPKVEAYKTKKWCSVCNVEIVSEVYLLSHLRGRKHQTAMALLSTTDTTPSDSADQPTGPSHTDAGDQPTGPSHTDAGDQPTGSSHTDAGDQPTDPAHTDAGDQPTGSSHTDSGDQPTDPSHTDAGDKPTGPAHTDAGDQPTGPAHIDSGDQPIDPSHTDTIGVIVDAAEKYQKPSGGQPEIQQRILSSKKKARKLRQRMSSRVKKIENNKSVGVKAQATNRARLQRALKELNKQVDSACGGQRPELPLTLSSAHLPPVDRALGEISRSLVTSEDQLCFCQLGGVASVLKMLMLSVENCTGSVEQWGVPHKTFSLALNVLLNCCAGQCVTCRYLITSNKAVPLTDLSVLVLGKALASRPLELTCGMREGSDSASLCGPLLRLLASMVSRLAVEGEQDIALIQQITDTISYMVSVGLMDKLGEYFISITGPIEQPSVTQLVLGGLNLLVSTTAFLHYRVVNVFTGKTCDDPTLLTTVLRQTELLGLMQLLYAILLSDGPPRHSHSPPPLSQHIQAIALATIKALNNSSILDLKMVQSCLGAEGISLEFRHIVSYLLWYCSHYENTALLHELILAVGYFCVLNHDNQVYLQSGRNPNLLQLLCGLPFEYFSNPKLSQLLYPTLVSACYLMEENKAILEEEISCKLLVTFLQESCQEEDKLQRANKDAQVSSGKEKNPKLKRSRDLSSVLHHRFPKAHWEPAITYFSQPSQVITP